MEGVDLDQAFQDAVDKVSNSPLTFPPDVLLHFYAYYKQATQENMLSANLEENDLRSAFKYNAWRQVKHMTPDEAKRAYIDASERFLKEQS
ncbi:acyl-CoA-binding protein [Croceiramulus getboli]|nr:acyl-CoA-binding protein [Flavobacteriaceae bacterium YJPT1-3]